MKLVELTNFEGARVMVNVDKVCLIKTGSEGKTELCFDGRHFIEVKETIEEIRRIMW